MTKLWRRLTVALTTLTTLALLLYTAGAPHIDPG